MVTHMRPVTRTTLEAIVAFLVPSLLALALCAPAGAQLAPPDQNAAMLRIATFGNPVYTAGFSWGLTSQLDVAGTYNFTSNTPTGSLWDAGVRYHFRVPASGVDAFVGAGIASASPPFMGFANGSGFTGGAGASYRFNSLLAGYGTVNIVSIGGTTSSIVDLGVELSFGNRVSGQLGYINFAGTGEPYLGVSFALH